MGTQLRSGAGALGMVAAVLLAAACASSSGAPIAAPTSSAATGPSATGPSATGPSATSSASGASQPEPGHTCAPTGAQIPAGAHRSTTPDVDYDGKSDTLWLADVDGKRLLGVQTASGAVFSTTFTSSAPQAAEALGQKMNDPEASSILLLDTGRSVKLYTVADCAIVPTTNPQHAQYTFDLGFTGAGTGVECTPDGTGYQLAGLLAKPAAGGETVYRTPITLSDYGRHAANGARRTLGTDLGSESSLVKEAHGVTCGTGNHAVTEPASS